MQQRHDDQQPQRRSSSTVPVQEPQQPPAPKRQPALSPELREFLHMLKSLESELEAPRRQQR
jgi:hypothetical protein